MTMMMLALLACEQETDEALELIPEVEETILEETPPTTVEAPADVAAPPADALTTSSGLAYVVLKPGKGDKPSAYDKVTVHYTGWTADGNMFDSSVTRGETSSFPLNRVIPGWTEGLQLMSVGEKTRFWIPQDIAYAGMPGKPAGMLVFDVELFEVEPGPRVPEDVAAAPATANPRSSGCAWRQVTAGTGTDTPAAGDMVEFHFTVWNAAGELQESTISSGRAVQAPIDEVVERTPIWSDELLEMNPGETRRIWAPAAALTVDGRPPPPGDLVFDLQLVSFETPPPPPATPSDVTAAPADAKKTATGLAYKVLNPGTGTQRPTASDSVTVHYSGWTTDGNMFDSSVARGEPSSFPLNRVIAGWTEGLQLMVPGEKTRFWIPEDLAYGGQPGKPAGMLVFDVELLTID